jgi:cobalt-zinc-cadmium efflux system outer membrane protein
MHGYRYAPGLLLGLVLLFSAGCVAPSSRDNVDAAARLVANQVPAPLEWRRNPEADAAARQRAEALLTDGVTLQEAVAIAFLASPELQLALEQLEVSRSDLVAAVTPPNPVLVVGERKPGGDLASFYPERSVSFGVLQNVIALLNIPDRVAVARHELTRVRYETADRATRHAAAVAQAWIEYRAALLVAAVRERSEAVVQLAYDDLVVRAANDGSLLSSLELQRSALLNTQAKTIRAVLAAQTARAQLEEQMGISGWRDDWRLADEGLPPLPSADPDPAALERTAIEQRYSLVAATEEVDSRLRVLATQRRFRWLNQLELGLFRDKAIGGTAFTGPNAVVELPLFDQRQATLLEADSQLRSALRRLEAAQLAVRGEIRLHAAEQAAARRLVEQIEKEIQPGQRQRLAEAGPGDPRETQRLALRIASLDTDEEHFTLLRDYWRARLALALAAGDWRGVSGLR